MVILIHDRYFILTWRSFHNIFFYQSWKSVFYCHILLNAPKSKTTFYVTIQKCFSRVLHHSGDYSESFFNQSVQLGTVSSEETHIMQHKSIFLHNLSKNYITLSYCPPLVTFHKNLHVHILILWPFQILLIERWSLTWGFQATKSTVDASERWTANLLINL